MNWYNRTLEKNKWYNEDEIEQNINVILDEDFNSLGIDNDDRMEIEEGLKQILSRFPPGYLIRREGDGWSVALPNGHIIALNERSLFDAARGGNARLNFLGLLI